jgi:hypothetical protein
MSASLRSFAFALFVLLFVLAQATPARAGEDWLPITPDELKMTSEPKAPGAMAVYLYRQVDRNDVEFREYNYARIKIFTEEGRKYADIEIPFVRGFGNIKNIQARTIHPDGRIIDFDGKVYEKMVIKAKGIKFLAKTFTMPDVQPGSIIEYRYTRINPEGWILDARWLLSDELFTKRAKFSLHQGLNNGLQWSWPRGLPPGTNPPLMDHRTVRLETQDVPAFQIEDYMPPPDEMKYRVEFMYTNNMEKDPDKFWKEEAKRLYRGVQAFTDKRKSMEQAVAQIVSPSDTPEEKLQKIYARCQKIRNTTFEREKSQQETDRAKLKEIESVEDIWKHGYGNGYGITWLFLALARTAGFDATPVLVSTRNTHFFNPKLMNPDDLNTNVVLIKLDGKDRYFDPGVAFVPFGTLPWSETDVEGLRVDKDGGTWVITPMPDPASSGISRQASFQLDDSGSLEGNVTITFKGLSALLRRIEENDADDAERKKFLEDEIKSYVPVTIEADLASRPDWNSSAATLVAEFHVKVPGWASAAGRHTLVPVGVFGGGEKHVFESSNRVHPIYFNYPYSDTDDVTISPPLGWQLSDLPQPQNGDLKALAFNISVDKKDGALHVSRRLMVNVEMVNVKQYATLRRFFENVRSADDQQVVLSASAPTN